MPTSCCYTLVIRQITCQNGVRRVINNSYNNIEDGTTIQLSFGYTLTIVSRNQSNIVVRLQNNNYIPTMIFSIPDGSYKEFNVPKESGTITILVGAKRISCPTTTCCSQNNWR